MGIDLPLIWALIIAVRADDVCGDGRLRPRHRHPVPVRARTGGDRDTMVNTVAPVWDGNETWLVLGGAALLARLSAGLFGAAERPLSAAVLMLLGLILRGVAFEFRFKADEAHRPFWDKAFAWGSYVATFCQGVALGAFINGFKVTGTVLRRRGLGLAARRSASLPASA